MLLLRFIVAQGESSGISSNALGGGFEPKRALKFAIAAFAADDILQRAGSRHHTRQTPQRAEKDTQDLVDAYYNGSLSIRRN